MKENKKQQDITCLKELVKYERARANYFEKLLELKTWLVFGYDKGRTAMDSKIVVARDKREVKRMLKKQTRMNYFLHIEEILRVKYVRDISFKMLNWSKR